MTTPHRIQHDASRPLWDTGIKAMTLFAPVHRGDLISLSAPAGHGCQVLLVELLQRADACVVALGARARTRHPSDFALMFADGLPPDRVHARVLETDDTQALDAHIERAIDEAIGWHQESLRDVFCVFDVALVMHLDDAQIERFKHLNGISVILFEAIPSGTTNSSTRWSAVADVVVRFSTPMAKAGIYPALDAAHSHGHIAQRWQAVVESARQCLAHPSPRQQRLQMYLSQPFFTAEYFTGIPGETVPRERVFEDVQAILDGAVDDVPLEQLRFKGALSL